MANNGLGDSQLNSPHSAPPAENAYNRIAQDCWSGQPGGIGGAAGPGSDSSGAYKGAASCKKEVTGLGFPDMHITGMDSSDAGADSNAPGAKGTQTDSAQNSKTPASADTASSKLDSKAPANYDTHTDTHTDTHAGAVQDSKAAPTAETHLGSTQDAKPPTNAETQASVKPESQTPASADAQANPKPDAKTGGADAPINPANPASDSSTTNPGYRVSAAYDAEGNLPKSAHDGTDGITGTTGTTGTAGTTDQRSASPVTGQAHTTGMPWEKN